MGFVSLAEVKAYLGITGTGDDVFLQSQTDIICDAAEKYCERKFSSIAMIEKWFKTKQDSRLKGPSFYTSAYPIVSVTYAKIDGEILTVDTEYRIQKKHGVINFVDGIEVGAETVEVSYTAGFVTIPKVLIMAVSELVGERYNKRKAGVDLGFGSDVQRVSIPGTISIDYDYSLKSNDRESPMGSILGKYLNVFDFYKSEKRTIGSKENRYVD